MRRLPATGLIQQSRGTIGWDPPWWWCAARSPNFTLSGIKKLHMVLGLHWYERGWRL